MGRAATGVRGIDLADGDELVGMEILSPGATVLTVTANGYGKRTPLEDYRVQNRGGMGIITIRTSERNGEVIGIAAGGGRRPGHADHERRPGAALPRREHLDHGPRHAGRAPDGARRARSSSRSRSSPIARTPPTCARRCRPRRRRRSSRRADEPSADEPRATAAASPRQDAAQGSRGRLRPARGGADRGAGGGARSGRR